MRHTIYFSMSPRGAGMKWAQVLAASCNQLVKATKTIVIFFFAQFVST